MPNYTTSFDKRKELSIFHLKVLEVLRKYKQKYKTAYPSYETIARESAMCLRKAKYVIKDLAEWMYLEKVARYTTLKDGSRKQLTNIYIVVETYPQEEEKAHALNSVAPVEDHAPKVLSSKSLKDFKPLVQDEHNNARITHEIFVKGMKANRVPERLYKLALRRLGDLTHYSVLAFDRALAIIRSRFSADRVRYFPGWFPEVLRNENVLVKHFGNVHWQYKDLSFLKEGIYKIV